MSTVSVGTINNELRNQITKIDTLLNAGSVYTNWVEFNCGGLHLNTNYKEVTVNKKSVSISGNLIAALRFQKNGSGQANAFTLTIYYAPEYGDDINIIDNSIAGTLENAMCSCTLRFGYNIGTQCIATPTYLGSVFDYNVEVQNNILTYTFTGYSSLATKSSVTFDIDAIEEPTKLSDIILKVYDTSYTQAFSDKHSGVSAAQSKFDLEFDNKDNIDSMCVKMTYGGATDVNFFQFLDELLGSARDDYTSGYATASGGVLHYGEYYYTIDDVNSKSVVRIRRREVRPSSIGSTYTFFWGGSFNKDTGCNMVQNFRTDYKGSINLAMRNAGTTKSYNVDDFGNAVETDSGVNGTSYAGDFYTAYDVARNNNQYVLGTQYSYTATLTTMGIPYDVPIGTYITVKCIIAQQVHHTSGTYMVTKTEDNVTTNGFNTTWSLVKICDDTGRMFNSEQEIVNICKAYHELDKANRLRKNVRRIDEHTYINVNNGMIMTDQ